MNNASKYPRITPLKFDASYEVQEINEQADIASLNKTLQKIADVTSKDYGKAVRSLHAKGHGVVNGSLHISEDLPPQYAQGLFNPGTCYRAIMRFSTIPGDVLDDNVSTPRGLALKIYGFEGDFLGSERSEQAQDFLLVNGATFPSPTIKGFGKNVSLLAKTTNKGNGLKKLLSSLLQATEQFLEKLGIKSATLVSLGGHPQTNLLGETYFSQTPILYGEYMAKVRLKPLSNNLLALTNQPVDLKDKPNGLRESVSEFFKHHAATWAIQVQLCTDIEKMPIEDSSINWSEELSPYVTVGTVDFQPQSSWDEHFTSNIENALSFSPWHALKLHRPLGSIMRARQSAYQQSAQFRQKHNGCPMHQVNDPNYLNLNKS